METFAFVDTNLLLHYQLFTEVDWHKQLGVADVTLGLAHSAQIDRVSRYRKRSAASFVSVSVKSLRRSFETFSSRARTEAATLTGVFRFMTTFASQ